MTDYQYINKLNMDFAYEKMNYHIISRNNDFTIRSKLFSDKKINRQGEYHKLKNYSNRLCCIQSFQNIEIIIGYGYNNFCLSTLMYSIFSKRTGTFISHITSRYVPPEYQDIYPKNNLINIRYNEKFYPRDDNNSVYKQDALQKVKENLSIKESMAQKFMELGSFERTSLQRKSHHHFLNKIKEFHKNNCEEININTCENLANKISINLGTSNIDPDLLKYTTDNRVDIPTPQPPEIPEKKFPVENEEDIPEIIWDNNDQYKLEKIIREIKESGIDNI